jgi:hypothetical protein
MEFIIKFKRVGTGYYVGTGQNVGTGYNLGTGYNIGTGHDLSLRKRNEINTNINKTIE